MIFKRYESTVVDWRFWQPLPLDTFGPTAVALTK